MWSGTIEPHFTLLRIGRGAFIKYLFLRRIFALGKGGQTTACNNLIPPRGHMARPAKASTIAGRVAIRLRQKLVMPFRSF